MDIDYEKLIRLQELDSEIRQVNLFLESIPQKTEDIDKKIEAGRTATSQAKEKLSQNQKKRRDLEGQVKDTKAYLAKYKRQLNEVKSNKEYTALMKEIDEAQKQVDRLEEEIIGEMLTADDIEKEIQEAGRKFAQEETQFDKEKSTFFQRKKESEEKIARLALDRELLLPLIPQDQRSLYLKIYQKKSGIPLSPVTDDFCSMCHVRIRPQVLNELREMKKLILCENCGRILYWKQKPPETQDGPEAVPDAADAEGRS